MNLLQATLFAANKHSSQRRKNPAKSPYINHPIEVAEHLQRVGGITDDAILIAALLHDTIEDTDTSADEIREQFGDAVLALVLECTDDKSLPKQQRKRLQIVNAPHKSDGAKLIKISDKTCNLRSILDDPPSDWQLSRQQEYFTWAGQVVAGLRGINTALDNAFDHVFNTGREKLHLPQ